MNLSSMERRHQTSSYRLSTSRGAEKPLAVADGTTPAVHGLDGPKPRVAMRVLAAQGAGRGIERDHLQGDHADVPHAVHNEVGALMLRPAGTCLEDPRGRET